MEHRRAFKHALLARTAESANWFTLRSSSGPQPGVPRAFVLVYSEAMKPANTSALAPGLVGAAALIGLACAIPAHSETQVVGDQVQLRESTVETPRRGSLMSAVEARFGAPRSRHDAVGNPPITRWDYDGFSVYFEHQHVIHAVATAISAPPSPAP
jgi:hypothetical protein